MSGITHEWSGSILTVTSDSGTTSADLMGPKGDTGPRGPQGPAGVIYDATGKVVVDLDPYATIEYVDAALENVDVDLSAYPTKMEMNNTLNTYASKNYVKTEVAKAQLEGAGVDTSGFATKEDLADIDINIDNKTLIKDTLTGQVRTAIGGWSQEGGGINYKLTGLSWMPTGNWGYNGWTSPGDIGNIGKPWGIDVMYHIEMTFKDGDTLKFNLMFEEARYETMFAYEAYDVPENIHISSFYAYEDGGFQYDFKYAGPSDLQPGDTAPIPSVCHDKWILTSISIYAAGFEPIDGNYIPVDGSTIYLNNEGKLACAIDIGEGGLDLANYYTKAEIDALLAGANIPSSEEVSY